MSQHLNPKELAERWRTCEDTLTRWRMDGVGLPFLKIQGLILYRLEDIEACEHDSIRRSTSSRLTPKITQGDAQ
jgi:hypothetical protein